ncbi:hypothetical protein IE53DRAFT_382984 [Violaceomyces palustris]|uniref:Uncharacterized protein n=1 Tax=Violaceomyces palustris TaxID=1673888 RepID=A0ACD0P8S1_9BASI|nr:hypothetical protein IE53DRAFT_382984 [Violaceomyces palustris]
MSRSSAKGMSESSTENPSPRHTDSAGGSGASPSSSSQTPDHQQERASRRPRERNEALVSTAWIVITTASIAAGLHLYSTFSSESSGSNRLRSPDDLDPRRFKPLKVTRTSTYPSGEESSYPACKDHKYLALELPSDWKARKEGREDEEVGEVERLRIRSVYFKEPSLQIERAYTPLYDTLLGTKSRSLSPRDDPPLLEFLIKRYTDGELGRYAHRLGLGDKVEVRGPLDTWSWSWQSRKPHYGSSSVSKDEQLPDEVVMIVGGTGITPAFQLLTSVLGRPSSEQGVRSLTSKPNSNGDESLRKKPHFTLLYSTRSIGTALLLPQIHSLVSSNPGRLTVGLFLESTDDIQSNLTELQGDASLESTTSSLRMDRPDSSALSRWLRWPLSKVGILAPAEPFKPSGLGVGGGPKPDLVLVPSRPSLVKRDEDDTSEVAAAIPVYKGRIDDQRLGRFLSDAAAAAAALTSKDDKDTKGDGRDFTRVVLVCGPDGMVEAISGPKARDGRSQGRLGGSLSRLGLDQDEVWKL